MKANAVCESGNAVIEKAASKPVPLDATDPSEPVTVTSPTFGQLTVSLQPDRSLVSVGLASGRTADGTVTLTKA